MDQQTISKYRSEVIERFINIESIINAIICQHYLGRVEIRFYLEVLYDENFTFGLKRRILEKIVKDPDRKRLDDLRRANTIRNYFAHCGPQIAQAPNPSADFKVLDPRHIEKDIDFNKLHSEFMSIGTPLEEFLLATFRSEGGVANRAE